MKKFSVGYDIDWQTLDWLQDQNKYVVQIINKMRYVLANAGYGPGATRIYLDVCTHTLRFTVEGI